MTSDRRSPSPARCAIRYHPDGYRADRAQVKGRHSAGAGFLGGLVAWGEGERHWCSVARDEIFRDFADLVGALDPQGREAVKVHPSDHAAMSRIGCLYLPGPSLDADAWLRRNRNERGYSLCGVTHTVASDRAIGALGAFLTAPTQPWDALVCTSSSVKTVVERVIDGFVEFHARRGARLSSPVRLPVIPLGVDCAHYARDAAAEGRRHVLRSRLGIDDGDIAGLFFGRLSFHAKAHPTPMFLAAQKAAALAPGCRQHLLLLGQFPNPGTERNFRAAAAKLCPDVSVHFLDGADAELSRAVWDAADYFVSLSDNIQESFGLTPIEAMAAGLPVLVSDYDGYKDTVVHGETGFRVPTAAPGPGDGLELASRYALGVDTYDRYIGNASQATAVDVPAAARAIADMTASADLRRALGEAGRARAMAVYDWRQVVHAYRALWEELAELRRSAPGLGLEPAADGSRRPDFPDPFTVFAGHPTSLIGGGTRVALADRDVAGTLDRLRQDDLHTFPLKTLLASDDLDRLIALLGDGPSPVADLGDRLGLGGARARARLSRTVAWLYKYDLIVVNGDDDG